MKKNIADISDPTTRKHLVNAGVLKNTAPLTETRFLTTAEAQSLLRFKRRSNFWDFVRRNGIPFVKMSARRPLFDESALRAFIESRTVGKRESQQ